MEESTGISSEETWKPYTIPSLLPLLYHPSYHATSARKLEEVEKRSARLFFENESTRSEASSPNYPHTHRIPLLSSLCYNGVNPVKLHANSNIFSENSELAQHIKVNLL